MKGTSQLVAELRQARKAKDRESFLGGVYELVQRHKSWLAHRYGTFDERIEDVVGDTALTAVLTERTELAPVDVPDAPVVAEHQQRSSKAVLVAALVADALTESGDRGVHRRVPR